MCARIKAGIKAIDLAALAMAGASPVLSATALDQFKPVTQDRLLRTAENPGILALMLLRLG